MMNISIYLEEMDNQYIDLIYFYKYRPSIFEITAIIEYTCTYRKQSMSNINLTELNFYLQFRLSISYPE